MVVGYVIRWIEWERSLGKCMVIGDVHGCARELAELLDKGQADTVVLVGDLFTKGPEPAEVFSLIESYGLRAVMGNHDRRLIDVVDGIRKDDDEALACIRRLDQSHKDWLAWLRGLPLFEDVGRFTVVHAGLHPSGERNQTTAEMALNLRQWPMSEMGAAFWYEQYKGQSPVIFGHDARRGLVRIYRDGEPWIIGLDSGCVYGGELSGYIVGEDRLLQVRARKTYRPVG